MSCGGVFTRNFSKDSRITIMFMGIFATLICELLAYLIQVILFNLSIEIWPFIKIITIETLYNTILIILLYPLIEKTGDSLERIFKGKSILTKYY